MNVIWRPYAFPVVLALIAIGCTDIKRPPSTVVEPEVIGHWVSETQTGGGTEIRLDSGQSFVLPASKPARLAFANTVERRRTTLIMAGHEPSGSVWYSVLNPEKTVDLPADLGFCYYLIGVTGVNAYDEGAAIVILATAGVSAGQTSTFGVRLQKAPTMGPPPSKDAPWYGLRFGLCLDGMGRVAVPLPKGPQSS